MCDATLLVILVIAFLAIKAFQTCWVATQDAKLLKDNPGAWKTRQEVLDSRKQKRNERFGKAARAGLAIARWLFKK